MRCESGSRVQWRRLGERAREKLSFDLGSRSRYASRSAVLEALKACSIYKELESGRTVHRYAAENGEDKNIFVANTLVSMYSKCGSMTEAREVFDRIPARDVVSWSTLMLGYAENDEEERVLAALERMKTEACQPNARTYLAVVKACTTMALKEKGVEVDGRLVKSKALDIGRSAHAEAIIDVFVANSLVDMYAKCGSMAEAREVFERMPGHTPISWTSLILGYAENGQGELALNVFSRMQDPSNRGCEPDGLTYVAAVKACTSLAVKEEARLVDGRFMKMESLQRGMEIHSCATMTAWDSDTFLVSALVTMYSKCGSLANARTVFDKMARHDAVSWTALIMGYAENGDGDAALTLFERMQRQGCVPDALAFVAALTGCISLAAKEPGTEVNGKLVKVAALEKGMAVYHQAEQRGFDSNVFVTNTVLDMYVKCGSMADARRTFDRVVNRDVVSWNALIMGYVESRDGETALELFEGMQLRGYSPDALTLIAAVKACITNAGREEPRLVDGEKAKLSSLDRSMSIHSQAVKTGSETNAFLACSLVELYAACGSMMDARRVFDRTPHHDVVLWTALLMGYSENSAGELALSLYSSMRDTKTCLPDAQTLLAALKACGNLVALNAAKAVHADIYNLGLETDPFLETCLVDVYGKCGSMVDSQRVFDSIATVDSTTWTTLVAGYSRHGDTVNVFRTFQRLVEEGLKPDVITSVCVLSACSHAGLVEQGKRYFHEILPRNGAKRTIDHYICMVDIYARANDVQGAVALLKSMPFRANKVTWRTVLGACMKWKNVEVGRLAFESLLALDKRDSSAYTLMGNIYSSLGMWEDKARVESMRVRAQDTYTYNRETKPAAEGSVQREH